MIRPEACLIGLGFSVENVVVWMDLPSLNCSSLQKSLYMCMKLLCVPKVKSSDKAETAFRYLGVCVIGNGELQEMEARL